jgi:O-antigen/teichoic acid export membrane protein
LVGIAILMTPLATLRFESAIASAESEFEVFFFLKRALLSTFIFSCLISICLEIAHKYALKSINLPRDDSRYLLPILVLLFSLYSIVTQIIVRERQFKNLSYRGLLQNLVTGSLQYFSGLAKPNFFSLVIGEILGRIIGLLLLVPTLISILKKACKNLRTTTTNCETKPRSPVRFILPATLLDTASTSIFVILIFQLFGGAQSGDVAMAQRIVSVPVAILGLTLGQVLLGEYSFALRTNAAFLVKRTKDLYKLLIVIGCCGCALTYFLGPFFTDLVLGNQWRGASELVRIFAFSLGVNLMWNPISSLFLAYKLWRFFLVISSLRLFLIIGFAIFGVFEKLSYLNVIFVMSVGGSLAQIIGLTLLYLNIRNRHSLD